MNDYARARGRAEIADEQVQTIQRTPPRPLSTAQIAEVSETKRLVHQYMPELVPEIKKLVELGMIDGWRDVKNVQVFAKD